MNRAENVTPEQVTIAVTVHSRRKYVERAVSSGLEQTKPVRVMVVEDCGPDPRLQEFVKGKFGDRVQLGPGLVKFSSKVWNWAKASDHRAPKTAGMGRPDV